MYRKYIKRLFDIVCSFILIIITLPIMLLITIIIKISLGKLIIKETVLREGVNKKPFQMYKIRTKIDGTRGQPKYLRYTKVTRIIDIFRLNELPQLFNILIGDMSFIGPRPFLVNDKINRKEISEKRYLIKPGITGLAQVKGPGFISHKKKLEYDIIYYDNISFLLDLKIIFLTPISVFKEFKIYLKEKKYKN